MEQRRRSLYFRLIIVVMAIFLFGTFWLTARQASDPLSLTVVPQVPRENDPVIATFKLSNPASHPVVTAYQFYANGNVIKEGVTTLGAAATETHQYAYENAVKMGEQVHFTVKAQSEQGTFERSFSSPPYPPQTLSSFTSFASFSTTVMSSISTMAYYNSSFANKGSKGMDVGLIATVVLTLMLMFLELSQPAIQGRAVASIGKLRLRFSTITWILFIVFLGILYTKVVLIVGT